VAADGKLILLSDSGKIVFARAGPESDAEYGCGTIFPDGICRMAPALCRRRLWQDKGFVYNYSSGIETAKGRRKPNDIRVVISWENMKKFRWALTKNGDGT
jgi:hypothetical protein